jgi:XTP/dITP diphosphohydrolase
VTTVVLATRSGHKAAEIRAILEPLRIEVVTLADVEAPYDPAEEDLEPFHTFQENAVAKARWFARKLGRVTMADDSGLRVDALGGRPGVRTKRFSGRADLDGSDLDLANNAHLLARLAHVPDAERGARYVCCAAVAWPDGRALTALGSVRGTITGEPAGEAGFGYDPLFHVPGLGARFAEVPADVKNAFSHRARAFRALGSILARAPWPLDPAS